MGSRCHINKGCKSGIIPLTPMGTNSTLFTECCGSAICQDERCCPGCGNEVIGADIESHGERGRFRWEAAARNWRKR